MPCPFQWLVITDGTVSDAGIRNQVDLVSTEGFCLLADGDWQPAITEPKGGGVWRDSQLADGRQPADFKASNVNESMTLTVSALDQDALIRDTQNLRRLLNKARTYATTAWQDEPVWIEAQSPGESEMRYAIIWNYSTPNDGNPYEEPFFQTVARGGMNDFTLGLEREPYWRADEPGTGAAVEISVVEAYNGINLGNVDDTGTRDPTTAEEVYVANKQNVANITNIHYFDSNAGAWSPNGMGVGLPFTMLPNPVLAGDVIVFGIDTTVADSGPFCSLVFDISTAMTLVTGTQWKYSSVGADPTVNWNNLTVQDNTDQDGAMTGMPFDTLGVNSVHWTQPAGWTVQNPTVAAVALGVTGYWVAMDIVTVAGGDTPPDQQNRDIYSITWPYIEAQSTAVLGDIAALAEYNIRNQSDFSGEALTGPSLWTSRVLLGVRSNFRGTTYFKSFINYAAEQNPAGITVTPKVGGFVADVTTPAGWAYAPGAGVAPDIFVQFETATFNEYKGVYHVFVRGEIVNASGADPANHPMVLSIQDLGVILWTSKPAVFKSIADWSYIDFGQVTLPTNYNSLRNDETPYVGRLHIGEHGTWPVTPTLAIRFYDLVLLPVDEWAADFTNPVPSDVGNLDGPATPIIAAALQGAHKFLRADSIYYPRRRTRAIASTAAISWATWQSITSSEAILQSNSAQRIYFLSFRNTVGIGGGEEVSELALAHSLLVNKNQRYESMRGDR